MSDNDLRKIRIKNVIGPTSNGTAVLLGDDDKTFVMFVGLYEGAAILRELNDESTPRPLTHELLHMVIEGFNVDVKRIVISDIVDNTFCATLVLEQRVVDESEAWIGKRNEVRIDARPSDCIILALKTKRDIYATPQVMEQVRDVTEELGELKAGVNLLQVQGPGGAGVSWEELINPSALPPLEFGEEGEGEEPESGGETGIPPGESGPAAKPARKKRRGKAKGGSAPEEKDAPSTPKKPPQGAPPSPEKPPEDDV